MSAGRSSGGWPRMAGSAVHATAPAGAAAGPAAAAYHVLHASTVLHSKQQTFAAVTHPTPPAAPSSRSRRC